MKEETRKVTNPCNFYYFIQKSQGEREKNLERSQNFRNLEKSKIITRQPLLLLS